MYRSPMLALALVLAACGAPADGPPELGNVPSPDAAGPTPDAHPAPEAGREAARGPDAAPDSGGPSPGPDAAPEAAPVPEASPPAPEAAALDAGPTMPEAGPSPEAGPDGAAPVCDSPSPRCAAAVRADERVRATFPQPCAPDGLRKCGGVLNGNVVESLPMVCKAGAWRLAGGWFGSSWVPAYECTGNCSGTPGQMCDP